MSAPAGLALRSLFRAMLLPGFLAGYVPWRWFGPREVGLDARQPLHWIGGLAVAAGTVLLARSGALLAYWAAGFAAVNLFVLGYEEPRLRRQFGAGFVEFAAHVPRWMPRLRPWRG